MGTNRVSRTPRDSPAGGGNSSFERIEVIPDRFGRRQRVGFTADGVATVLGLEAQGTLSGGPDSDIFADIAPPPADPFDDLAPAAQADPFADLDRPAGGGLVTVGQGFLNELAAAAQGTSPQTETITGEPVRELAPPEQQAVFSETGIVPKGFAALVDPADNQVKLFADSPELSESGLTRLGRTLGVGLLTGPVVRRLNPIKVTGGDAVKTAVEGSESVADAVSRARPAETAPAVGTAAPETPTGAPARDISAEADALLKRLESRQRKPRQKPVRVRSDSDLAREGAREALAQVGPDPDFDFLLDVMRGKRAVPKRPTGLTQFVVDHGGVVDDGGNLRALGAVKMRPGLINSRGVSLDDMALRATETGFFDERPTIAEFLDALGGDLTGVAPRINPAEAQNAAFFDQLRQVDEAITTEGIDLDQLTNAEVRVRLQGLKPEGAPRTLADLEADAAARQTARAEFPEQRAPGGSRPPMAGNINLGKIHTSKDAKTVISDTAEQFAELIDEARRGVITNTETRKLASDLGMTQGTLLNRRKGQAFNAEQALAARRILAQSADEVQRLADAARGGSDEALVAFQEALTRHVAIQEQVAGLTAEAGRALQAFNIPARGRARESALKEVLENAGGRDSVEDLAAKISALEDDPGINKVSREAFKPTLRQKLFEIWINSLLSGPRTQAVNFVSNALTQLYTLPEHALAAGFGALRKGDDKVFLREVPARMYGMAAGSRDGLAAAAKVLRTGDPVFDPLTKIEAQRFRAIGGRTGEVVRIPSRLLQASDDMFKAMAYRTDLQSLALRDGIRKGLSGPNLSGHVVNILANPPEAMDKAARAFARKVTFTSPLGQIGGLTQALANSIPGGRIIMPFIRTPANIIKFAVERSPLGLLMRDVREQIRLGGATRDLALARIGLGTSIGVAVASLAGEGLISGGGPSDPAQKALWRATGWQPYSVKIGDTWYAYSRLEPLGLLMGVSADFAEISGHLSQEDSERLGSLIVGSISKNLVSKTWLRGPAELVEAIQDPDRHGQRWLLSVAGTLIPTGVAQVAQTTDPVLRSTRPSEIDDGMLAEAQSIINRLKSRLPGYSAELPPVRNVWGEPVILSGGLGPDLISPVFTSKDRSDATSEELIRLRVFPSFLRRKLGGVRLTPEQYDRYTVLAGQPAKAALDAFMSSPAYPSLPDAARRQAAEDILLQSRRAAQARLKAEFPDLIRRQAQQRIEEVAN